MNIINIFIRTFTRKYKTVEVFTPGTTATLTYVKREKIEKEVKKFIILPGMQIILFGYSGCGKSTLIINALADLKIKYIVSRCKSDTSLIDLLLSAFDKLDVFYKSEKAQKENHQISGELSARYDRIGSKINSSSSEEVSSLEKRVAQVQLSPERLAEFLGAAKCIWIIEDFHKVSKKEKTLIADIMKIFSDTASKYPATKIVCIGAVATARELVELDSNLSDRVAQIPIPLLTDTEILNIITIGSSLLNLSISRELKEQIAYYSNNLALICHQLCFDICYNKDINKTKIRNEIIINDDFKKAVFSHIEKKSDTLKSLYDKITSARVRKLILEAFIDTDKEFLLIEEIHEEICKHLTGISPEISQNQIELMISPKYDEVLRIENYTMKISFSNQFFKSYVKMSLDLEKLEKQNKQLRIKKKHGFEPDKHESIFDRLNEYIPLSSLDEINKYFKLSQNRIDNYIKTEDTVLYPIGQVPVIELNRLSLRKLKITDKRSDIRTVKKNRTIPRSKKR